MWVYKTKKVSSRKRKKKKLRETKNSKFAGQVPNT